VTAQLIGGAFVLVVAVIALPGCDSSSNGQPEGSAPPSGQATPSAAEATPDTSTSAPVDHEITHFTSPTGNVGCVIGTGGVRCDIAERDWSPPPQPADCELDYGHAIGVGSGRPARFLCAGDTTLGGGEPLAYGDAITAGPMRCESAPSGMTCRDVESGNGFFISREEYRLF
jgi:hypothetical protein